ncbi:hypothetical protein KR51_00006040 [Rubidibacter lacunae KORDI 51-2]|uniref:Uncharacterized protein n=1 Tax=Rubidibacter lacunae KORDI 51-2 TaxID=582515 RepID=U5DM50_9CHRO|nr:hypothetical protein [Rubidibacter lacunae]ERN42756.1 hypothetical protein KR51_00006040 [Rubidibacter lacunae KORDI 51-2]
MLSFSADGYASEPYDIRRYVLGGKIGTYALSLALEQQAKLAERLEWHALGLLVEEN